MTDLPTTLPDLALAFCKEVLGWDYIPLNDDGSVDLPGDILERAKAWCEENRLSLFLKQQSNGSWLARAGNNTARSRDCYRAVFAACIKAHRELKGKDHAN